MSRCYLFLILLLTAVHPVHAHHFKGLPHFSYFENYPQIPQEEFLWQEGEYEFSLVLYDFQGLQRREMSQPDGARLFLVIYNLRENRVYGGALLMEVLDDGDPVLHSRRQSPEEEMVYQIHGILSPAGKYSLRVHLLDEPDAQAVIPFQLSSQKIGWDKWVAAGLLVLVTVAGIGARKARVIQDRKSHRGKRIRHAREVS